MVQNKIEDVLAWRNPIETISAMTIFSLITANPALLIVLPIFILVFALLVPSYLVRHPPPPSAISSAPIEVTQAISPPPQTAKPVPELSRDFFMNMRDIQNSMDDFNNVYDLVRAWVMDIATFKNEPLSSTILAFTCIAVIAMIVLTPFLPMRWIMLVLGNAAILVCHPIIYRYLLETYLTPEEIQRIKQQVEQFVREDYIPPPPSQRVSYTVEIFESRRLLPPVPPNHFPDWSPSMFSPFPPQATNSTNKLNVVSPPQGYAFVQEDWKIDENKQKWTTDRAVHDETGFWIAEGDDFEREGEGWVVYESSGWKVRRLTREVIRVATKD
jgi:Integral peroxisomal membrane peroxin